MRFYLERHGPGPPIVLLHGFGFSGAVFSGLVGRLRAAGAITVIDLPGFGRSPWDPEAAALWPLTDALVSALPVNAVWIGWSYGGMLAAAAACRYPERIKALCLIAASPRFVAGSDWPFGLSEASVSQLAIEIESDRRLALDRFAARLARGDRTVLRSLREAAFGQGLPDTRSLLSTLEVIRHADLRAEIGHIRAPTLVVSGAADPVVAPDTVE